MVLKGKYLFCLVPYGKLQHTYIAMSWKFHSVWKQYNLYMDLVDLGGIISLNNTDHMIRYLITEYCTAWSYPRVGWQYTKNL